GAGNHTKIRKSGIPPADAGNAHKYLAEAVVLRDLLQLGAGIGDGDKTIAHFFLANLRFDAFEEILLINIGFERASGLARNDEKGAPEIDFLFDGFDLRGIGGIE